MKIPFLALSFCLLWAVKATAATGHYQFQNQSVSFTYDPGLTATALPQGQIDLNAKSPFAAMGFSLSEHKAGPHSLMPVWFAGGGTGIMKNRIAVGLRHDANGYLWRDRPEVVGAEVAAYAPHLVFLDTTTALAAMTLANELSLDTRVKYAHPMFHFPVEQRSAVDEPLFGEQWHLSNTGQRGGTPGSDLNVLGAWDITEGSAIVGLIDLGFEQDHPDLQGAWLINSGEIVGNRIDDDGNGLVDDWRGWNFDTKANNLIYGSSNSHGTATAGLIAAPANGIGVTGVCPGCKVLPMVIYSDIEHAVAAFYYARDRGAQVISNSWGYRVGTPQTDVLMEAISDVALHSRAGKGISILFAMPNFGGNACRAGNPDISSHPDVLAISSVDYHDKKVPESGIGPCLKFVGPTAGSQVNALVTTDRAGDRGYNRPGVPYTDLPDQDYTQSFYGTSAATPALAGVFALMYSLDPTLTATKALQIAIETAVRVSPEDAQYNAQGFSESYGYGRLDATKALQAVEGL